MSHQVHAKQLSPILLGHVARIIGCVASVVATNSTQTTLISNQAASLRSCSLLQLKPILCASESPPVAPHVPQATTATMTRDHPLIILAFRCLHHRTYAAFLQVRPSTPAIGSCRFQAALTTLWKSSTIIWRKTFLTVRARRALQRRRVGRLSPAGGALLRL